MQNLQTIWRNAEWCTSEEDPDMSSGKGPFLKCGASTETTGMSGTKHNIIITIFLLDYCTSLASQAV